MARLTAHTAHKAKGDCTQLKQKPLDLPRETKQLRDIRVSHFEHKTTPMSRHRGIKIHYAMFYPQYTPTQCVVHSALHQQSTQFNN